MKQKYLVIDLKYCHDCNNCFIACKDEHVSNDWLPYTWEQPRHGHRWMNILSQERGQAPRMDVCFLPMPCQHCANAPCIKAYPGCISRRDDGIVLIDAEKAKGKKEIVESCPYGAMYWNEEKNVPQKCTMCAHLLDDGKWNPAIPRCSHSCPTLAIQYYEIEPEEMAALKEKEGLSHHRPELGCDGNVYYKNYHRFTKHFISGAVLKGKDAWENATVTLKYNGDTAEQKTDYFGEFKFDGLDAGEYSLYVEGKKMKDVAITESMNIGEITI